MQALLNDERHIFRFPISKKCKGEAKKEKIKKQRVLLFYFD